MMWEKNGNKRMIVYDKTVPIVGNNVDACIFSTWNKNIDNLLGDPSLFLALGELKGGIDPAGADEHWKTANTALQRINNAFKSRGLSPATFFIGAAIERKMSEEIWRLLESNSLTNAANLTKTSQISSLCDWIINL